DTEHNRHAYECIRRAPTEDIMIKRGNRSGREAEQKSIKCEMVKQASCGRRLVVLAGAAAAPAMQIGQMHRIRERAAKNSEIDGRRFMTNVAPEGTQAHPTGKDDVKRHRAEKTCHHIVR